MCSMVNELHQSMLIVLRGLYGLDKFATGLYFDTAYSEALRSQGSGAKVHNVCTDCK